MQNVVVCVGLSIQQVCATVVRHYRAWTTAEIQALRDGLKAEVRTNENYPRYMSWVVTTIWTPFTLHLVASRKCSSSPTPSRMMIFHLIFPNNIPARTRNPSFAAVFFLLVFI